MNQVLINFAARMSLSHLNESIAKLVLGVIHYAAQDKFHKPNMGFVSSDGLTPIAKLSIEYYVELDLIKAPKGALGGLVLINVLAKRVLRR